ncbi:hypothetical protein ACWC9X_12695 [Streptomyces asoensis]
MQINDSVERLKLTAPETPEDLREAALFFGALDDLYVRCVALVLLAQVPDEEDIAARSELVAQSQTASTAERPRIERVQSGSLEVFLAAALPLTRAALGVFSAALTNVEKLWTLPSRIKVANAQAEAEIAQAQAARAAADVERAQAETAIEEIKGRHQEAGVDFALVGRRQSLSDLAAHLTERLLPEIDEALRTLNTAAGGHLDVEAVQEESKQD